MSFVSQNRLQWLEARTVELIREVTFSFPRVCMLWSIGKDSTSLLWMVRKAFHGVVPFPVIHIDTSFKIPEMISYRQKLAVEWGLDLIVGQNRTALAAGEHYPAGTLTRLQCCQKLKTEALLKTVNGEWPVLRLEHATGLMRESRLEAPFDAIIVGLRGDEEGSRSKERYVSPRGRDGKWDISLQPAELWGTFLDTKPEGGAVRVHPLLDWTELDVWRYVEAEGIPLTDLYLSRGTGERYRSLGCACCTNRIVSTANSVQEVLHELEGPLRQVAERSGRAQDAEDSGGLERLRRDGYM